MVPGIQQHSRLTAKEFYNKVGWFPFPAVEGSDADPLIQIDTVGDQFITFNCTGDKLQAAFDCAATHVSDEVIDYEIERGKIPPIKGVEDKLTDPLTKEIVDAANSATGSDCGMTSTCHRQ